MRWLIPIVFLVNACSLIYCAGFIEAGKRLTTVPAKLRGDWVNTGLSTTSYIERISIEKSYFSIKYSGSESLSDAVSVTDATVRISFQKPFYLVQVTTEKGVSVIVLTLTGDTLKLFNPNLQKIEEEFKLRRQTGLFGVSELLVDTSSARLLFSHPDTFFVPGDLFVKRPAKHD